MEKLLVNVNQVMPKKYFMTLTFSNFFQIFSSKPGSKNDGKNYLFSIGKTWFIFLWGNDGKKTWFMS